MQDVTECPADTIPAHVARLDGLLELIGHLCRHDYAETPEARLSGVQLTQPCTLADYQECLRITRRAHRAPAFINQRDGDIAEIKRGINLLGGILANRPDLIELLAGENEPELQLQEGGGL